MSVQIYSAIGTCLRSSRNLRCIGEHARVHNPATLRRVGERILRVDFPGGDVCETQFADGAVLDAWIADRVRYGRGKFVAG